MSRNEARLLEESSIMCILKSLRVGSRSGECDTEPKEEGVVIST